MVIFNTFCKTNEVSGEKGGPLFLHTLTVFWLGFEGLGPPRGRQKREKTPSKKSLFFLSEKKAIQTVFCDFRLFFGVILGGLSDDLRVCFGVFFEGGSPGSFWTPFWLYFGSILD